MRFIARDNAYFLIFLVILLGVLAAFSLPPSRAMAEAHDGLESVTTHFLMMGRFRDVFFDLDYFVPQFQSGRFPLSALSISDFHLAYLPFVFLGPFTAYVVVVAMVKVLTFCGMYLLLKDHVLPRSTYNGFIAAVAAFCFAMITNLFYFVGTAALVPLVAWAFLNVWRGERHVRNWIAWILYPFLSVLHLGGFAVYTLLGAATLVALVRRKGCRFHLLAQTAAVAAVVLAVERRMFYHWLFASYEYVSSRYILYAPWFRGERGLDPSVWIEESVQQLVLGNETSHPDLHFPLAFAAILGALVFLAAHRLVRGGAGPATAAIAPQVRFLVAIFVTVSALAALTTAELHYLTMIKLFGFPFRLSRIDAVVPTLWWVMFALALVVLGAAVGTRWRFAVTAIAVVVSIHTGIQFPGVKERFKEALDIPRHVGLRAAVAGTLGDRLRDYEIGSISLAKILGTEADERPRWRERAEGRYAFGEYFELDHFDRIKRNLAARLGPDQSSYRVISVDLAPSVALFHGFYPLDGNFSDYAVAYYEEFWELFRDELQKDGVVKGHRLEFPIADRSRLDNGINPDFDTCLFRKRSGRVVISRSNFAYPTRLFLDLVGQYGDLFVYVVGDVPGCDLTEDSTWR